jgi:hypothetical protein
MWWWWRWRISPGTNRLTPAKIGAISMILAGVALLHRLGEGGHA